MSLNWLLFAEVLPAIPDPDYEIPVMGNPAEIRERISAGLGNAVVWHKDGWGQYWDADCMFDFHVELDENPVICVMIRVRGLKATEMLLPLAQQNEWCLVDSSFTPIRVNSC